MNDILLDSPTEVLEVELKEKIKQYPVIPNPPGEATESLEKMGIDGVVYQAYDTSVPSFIREKYLHFQMIQVITHLICIKLTTDLSLIGED